MALYKNLKQAIDYLEKKHSGNELNVELYAQHDKLYIKVDFYKPNGLTIPDLETLMKEYCFRLDPDNFSYSVDNWNDSAMKAKTVFFYMNA